MSHQEPTPFSLNKKVKLSFISGMYPEITFRGEKVTRNENREDGKLKLNKKI